MLQRHRQLAIAGSIHFVTTVTSIRGRWFTDEKTCKEILEFFEWYRAKQNLDCLGYVLMPDHLHALLFQPDEGDCIPKLILGFKQISSRRCLPANYPKKSLWHSRYDDVPVPGSGAARTKLDYIHYNPVKNSLIENPQDWPWSSAKEYFSDQSGIVKITKLSPLD